MKRILLFVMTNLAVMVVLGIVINLFGLNRWLDANGLNVGGLLMFSLVVGFGGATITAYLGFTLGLTGGGSADAVTVEWDNVSASVVGLR